MPLNFDAASLMAPGGIVSGLDDLGAAVTRALDRRAERRYASEAAARRAAIEESQFARQLQSRSDLQEAGDAAAMDRLKLTETGNTGRKLVGEVGSTARNVLSNATDLAQTGITAFAHVLGGRSSASKDGVVDEEKMIRDLMKNADAAAIKAVPENQLAAMSDAMNPEAPYAAGLAKQRAAYRESYYKKAGYEMDPATGTLRKIAAKPAAAPATAAAPAATVAPDARAARIASIRAQLKIKQVDDSKFTDDQLAARYGVK